MHFPYFFHPLSIIFFPNMLFVHIFATRGGGQTEKYTPLLDPLQDPIFRGSGSDQIRSDYGKKNLTETLS